MSFLEGGIELKKSELVELLIYSFYPVFFMDFNIFVFMFPLQQLALKKVQKCIFFTLGTNKSFYLHFIKGYGLSKHFV